MRKLLMVLIVGVLLLSCVQVLRGETINPLGSASYNHMHASKLTSGQDNLVMGGNWVWQQPIDYVLKLLPGRLLEINMVCSLLSIILVWLLLKKLGIAEDMVWLSTGLWTLSPLFIHMAYVGDGVALIVVLQLLAFYLVLQRWEWSILSGILFLIASLHSLWQFVIVALGLGLLARQETYRNRALGLVFGVAVGATILHLQYLATWWHLPLLEFTQDGAIIADLGGNGLGIFTVVLGVFGLLRKTYRKWLFIGMILLGLSTVERSVLPGVLLLCAYGGGSALFYLLERKWEIKELQGITILLIACGVVFSPLAYARELSNMQPSSELVEAMEILAKMTESDAVVLTSPENAAFVQAIAERKVLLPVVYYGADANARWNMTQKVWYSYNLPEVEGLLRLWNITHVFVSPEMVTGGIWDEPNQAFHYLLGNNDTFIKLHDTDGYALWEVRKL